jgi:hypothetical protein
MDTPDTPPATKLPTASYIPNRHPALMIKTAVDFIKANWRYKKRGSTPPTKINSSDRKNKFINIPSGLETESLADSDHILAESNDRSCKKSAPLQMERLGTTHHG